MYSRRHVLAALGVAAVAGCASDDGSSGDGTIHSGTATTTPPSSEPDVRVVTDYSSEAWQRKWNGDVLPGFEQESSRTVEVEYPPEYHARLRELARDGDFPEVFTSSATEVAKYVAEGRTRPVDDLVSALSDSNGPLIADHSIRGPEATHLVPHGLSMVVFNYRADVYDALGLSVPRTWAELRDNTRAIAESDEVDAAGFAVPAGAPDTKPREDFLTWLYSAGGGLWEWTDAAQSVALDFATDGVRVALEEMRTLGQYSPTPARAGYTGTLSAWIQGDLAQCFFPNAALAGFTYDREHPGATAIARQTRQAAVPLRDASLSPPTRGHVWIEGTPVFRGADAGSARQFLRYMYQGPAAQADKNGYTMRFLPPYEGIVETDAYRSGDVYRAEGGHFWDLERSLVADVAPEYRGRRPRTPAAWYAMQGTPPGTPSILGDLVRHVVDEEDPIEGAIERARTRLRDRLEAGRRLAAG